ncbi:receptor-like protein kinase [Corchorus olitorius]|uniref:RING-type E3 ubiquitin transferase n=1 Tax=Corchorus olitorius TaxID=93759 RepID=A0A1R3K0Z5_9ROSI|nr:receptor-like protein kinase [Corchorus olitorius]
MTSQNVIGFHFIFFLLLLCLGDAGNTSCPLASCSENGPPIRFPFWLKGRQPENCGYPGFELSCSKKNRTLIQLSTSVQLLVTAINYRNQFIDIGDPEGCMARKLITLNVTGSHFKIFWSENFTLLNCSSTIEVEDQLLIDCLSSSTRYVYAVHDSMPVSPLLLSACGRGFIANIQASYDPTLYYRHRQANGLWLGYLNLNRFSKPPYRHGYSLYVDNYDLIRPPMFVTFRDYTTSLKKSTRLSWVVPGCDQCEYEGGKCRFKSNSGRELECEKGFIENPSPIYESHPIEGNSPNTSMRGNPYFFIISTLPFC